MPINFIKNKIKVIEIEGNNITLKGNSIKKQGFYIYGSSEQETIYPSTIKNCGKNGSINISVYNKNVCYKTELQDADNIRFYFKSRNISKIIAISFVTNVSLNRNSIYCLADGISLGRILAQVSTDSKGKVVQQIIFTDEEYEKIKESNETYFLLYKNNAGFTIPSNVIIENDTTDTEYTAHLSQNISFPMQEKQLLMKGDYLASDGIHHIRKQIELDGTENWKFGNKKTNTVNLTINDSIGYASEETDSIKALCSHFPGNIKGYESDEPCFWFNKEGGFRIRININELADTSTNDACVESFKTYLSEQKAAGTPVILEYELATEEVEIYTQTQQNSYNQLENIMFYNNTTHIFSQDEIRPNLKIIAKKFINYLSFKSLKLKYNIDQKN